MNWRTDGCRTSDRLVFGGIIQNEFLHYNIKLTFIEGKHSKKEKKGSKSCCQTSQLIRPSLALSQPLHVVRLSKRFLRSVVFQQYWINSKYGVNQYVIINVDNFLQPTHHTACTRLNGESSSAGNKINYFIIFYKLKIYGTLKIQ